MNPISSIESGPFRLGVYDTKKDRAERLSDRLDDIYPHIEVVSDSKLSLGQNDGRIEAESICRLEPARAEVDRVQNIEPTHCVELPTDSSPIAVSELTDAVNRLLLRSYVGTDCTKFVTALDPTEMSVLLLTPEDRCFFAGSEAANMLETDPEQLVGRHVDAIFRSEGESALTRRLPELDDDDIERIKCQEYNEHTDDWFDMSATTLADVVVLSLEPAMSRSAASAVTPDKQPSWLEKMTFPAFTLTNDLRVHSWNDYAEDAFGWSETELRHNRLPIHSSFEDVCKRNFTHVIEGNSFRNLNIKLENGGGDVQTVSCSLIPLAEEQIPGSALGIITDISDEEDQFESLRRALDALNAATSREELLAQTIDQLDGLVHHSYAALFVDASDGDRLTLETNTAGAVARFGPEPTITPEQTHLWEPFESDEMEYVSDLTWVDTPATDIRSEVLLPLGGHGLLAIGSTSAEAFPEHERELLSAYANVVTTNLRHFEQNELLHSYKDRVRHLSRDLETATSESTLVQEIITALRTTREREKFTQTVCERLVDRWSVAFASYYDAGPRGFDPQTWAEAPQADVQLHELGPDDIEQFVSEAFETQSVQSVRDDFVDNPNLPSTFEMRAIPVTFRDQQFGVLLIGDSQPGYNHQRRQFAQTLGHLVGLALDAIDETRTWLLADWVEYDVRVGGDLPLTRVANALGERIELSSVSTTPTGLSFTFTVSTSATETRETIQRALDTPYELVVESIDEDISRCELRMTSWGLSEFQNLQSLNARIVSCVATDEAFHCRLEVPSNVSVEEIREGCALGAASVSVESTDGRCSERDRTHIRNDLRSKLTERQLEVLRTAIDGGFYDWPRAKSGQEIADELDIAQPTFHNHLRTAERKVFEYLYREMFDGLT